MSKIKYYYALNENSLLTSITDISEDSRKGHTYHCLCCGAEMIPRMGKIKTWHFAHKGNDDNCNSETYLHKLSKRLIKDKFNSSQTFEIKYYKDTTCSDIMSCPFARKEECRYRELESHNLKEYYDTCLEEQRINGFVADLLLSNSAKPDRKPTAIEIQVTHKCTEKKYDSGLRIIELKINTQEDIINFLHKPLMENPEAEYRSSTDYLESHEFAKFYNFKRDSSKTQELARRGISHFYLFRSGKAYVSNLDDMRSCRDTKKDNPKSIFEACIDSHYLDTPSPYEFGFMAARQNGIAVKTCQFCKYHKNGFEVGIGDSPIFCSLYKKFGLPMHPERQFAKECQYYREDKVLLDNLRAKMPSIVIASGD